MAYANTHSNMTSKLVVGFGLAALCAVGASIFAVQAKRQVANDAVMSSATQPLAEPPAAAMPDAATTGDTSPPPPIANSALPTTAPAETPVPPVVDEPVAPVKAKKKATRTSDPVAKPPVIDSAPPAMELTPSVSSTDAAAAASTAAPADQNAQQPAGTATATAPVATEATAPSTTAASDAAPSDTQISESVKSEIASAEPTSKVVVTTTNGAVSLVGSVPSQEAIVQASQAAQRIAGVKSVDATGLFVSNP